jgi:hypothetical protein
MTNEPTQPDTASAPAFVFDLDGTLVDSVYQHVLAWREALEREGISLSVWRIHRRIGMSGGLLVNGLLRETGLPVTREQTRRLRQHPRKPLSSRAAGSLTGCVPAHNWELPIPRQRHTRRKPGPQCHGSSPPSRRHTVLPPDAPKDPTTAELLVGRFPP